MEKDQIILIGNKFYNSNSLGFKLIFLIMGILAISLAISNIRLSSSLSTISLISLINGSFFIGYALIVLNKNSSFAPKIAVNSIRLSIKNSVFKKPFIYKWEEIDYISFGKQEVTIHYSTKSNTIYYKSSSSNAEMVQRLIQQEAIAQKIPIMGS